MKKGYKALLAEADAEVQTLPVDQALSLHGDPGVVFVDLRDPREIQREGRIPGAFSCPRGMLEFWVDPDSPYAKPVSMHQHRHHFVLDDGGAGEVLVGRHGHWRAVGGMDGEDMGAVEKHRFHIRHLLQPKAAEIGL